MANRTPADVESYRQNDEITVKSPAPNPVTGFDEANIPDYFMNEMVGIVQTGSGKTLAYILPAIVHINLQEPVKRGDGPIALVLATTRELAQQIQQVATDSGSSARVHNTCVLGGAAKGGQAVVWNVAAKS